MSNDKELKKEVVCTPSPPNKRYFGPNIYKHMIVILSNGVE